MKDFYIIDPQQELLDNVEFQGMMICSDGIEPGVKNGEVQKAITKLFTNSPTPSATQICEAAVQAAQPYSTDNITATFLPEDASAMIAVADGFNGSAATADAAIKCIRSKCPNPPGAGRGSSAGLAQ